MSFFKSLKGKMHHDENSEDSNKTPTNRPSTYAYEATAIANEKSRTFGSSAGPAGPETQSYKPPPGPPPSYNQFAPPSGPPPTQIDSSNPPPYLDWLAVPDNALLPPPPSLHDDYSPAHNASEESATIAKTWCERHPVFHQGIPNETLMHTVREVGDLRLEIPQGFKGKLKQLSPHDSRLPCSTRFLIATHASQDDTTLLTSLPLYFAAHENPLLTQNLEAGPRSVSISFSIQVNKLHGPDAIVAIGFASKPYPPYRLPGWHRSSLAVHSDDGRRYVNDSWGGQDFVKPFKQGDLITLTMTMQPSMSPVQKSTSQYARPISALPRCSTKVHSSRNGKLEGSWNIHEERDAEKDEGIEGLQGDSDYYPAVGVSGGVEIEVLFSPQT